MNYFHYNQENKASEACSGKNCKFGEISNHYTNSDAATFKGEEERIKLSKITRFYGSLGLTEGDSLSLYNPETECAIYKVAIQDNYTLKNILGEESVRLNTLLASGWKIFEKNIVDRKLQDIIIVDYLKLIGAKGAC